MALQGGAAASTAAAAALSATSPSGQANWQRLYSVPHSSCSSSSSLSSTLSSSSSSGPCGFLGLPIFIPRRALTAPRCSPASWGTRAVTRSELGKGGGEVNGRSEKAAKGKTKRKQSQKKQQATAAVNERKEEKEETDQSKQPSEQEQQQQMAVAAASPVVSITLDDVNPVGLGRKSRQMFDEVWRKFSGLGQLSRTSTAVADDSLLDPALIRGPMCEFTIPEAQDTTVLVVGATSRIGRIVVRKLMLRGYRVKVSGDKSPILSLAAV